MKQTRPAKISRVRPGQPISANHYNLLVDSINRLMDAVGGPPQNSAQLLRVVETDEDIESYQRDKTANHSKYDTSITAGNDPITDWGIDDTYVSEIQNSVHLSGERLMLYFDRASGKQLVMPFTNWHIAKLTSDLTAGSSASAKIWQMGASTEEASAVSDITVYDWLMDEDGFLQSGTKVYIAPHRQSRRWYVVGFYPLKEWGRAEFSQDFTTSDATVPGTLTDQWGYGADHTDTDITLHNLETGTASEYVFCGSSGGACWCRYMGTSDDWALVIPECP